MGFYLLSSVLLMRASLPAEFRTGISEAAGDLEFAFYHHFFDSIFLFAATITAVWLLIERAIRERRAAEIVLERQLSGTLLNGFERHQHAAKV